MRASPILLASQRTRVATTFGKKRVIRYRSFHKVHKFCFSHGQATSHFSSTSASNEDKERNSLRAAIFPRTLPDPEGQGNKKRILYPKTFAGWKRVFVCAWTEYRSTWDGFMSGSSSDDDDTKTKKEEKSELESIIDDQRDKVTANIEKNIEYVEKEAPKFFDFVRKETKIYTKDDLKRWAGEQLKLATLCLNEFMAGYRSGRDGEMDKMLNEYFKEQDEEADEEESMAKRKRRKPKKLIRRA